MEIRPIMADDKQDVAVFLNKNLFSKISIQEWICGLFPSWSDGFPNHGHMMIENEEIVGVQIVIYSKMLVDGEESTFGNLSSWCVLKEFRKGLNSIMLFRKNISDKSVNYTATTPNNISLNIFKKFGFEVVDNSNYLISNFPAFYSEKQIITEHDFILSMLDEANLRIYKDHKTISWLKHLILSDGHDYCYVIYRDWKARHLTLLKNARILYISNPDVFEKMITHLRGFFFLRGHPAITISKRFLNNKPALTLERSGSTPLCYRGANATKEAFTNAYTQIMTFEAHY